MKVYDRWVFSRGDNQGKKNPKYWGEGWRYRVRYTDISGKVAEKVFWDGEKGQAYAFVAAQNTHQSEGRQLDVKNGKQLIAQYGPAYVDSLVVTESTRKRYGTLLKKQIMPYLGGRQIASCVPTTIQVWVRELEKDGNSPATIRLAYDFIGAMFKRAVRDRLIAFTPCEDIKLPAPVEHDFYLPQHHEVHELATAAPARYRAKVYVASGCGLRHGEVWALDMDSVDLVNRKLRVRYALAQPEGRGGMPRLVRLKTKAAYREVPMNDHVVAALREHIAAGYVQDVQVLDTTARRRKGQPIPVVTKKFLFAGEGGTFASLSAWYTLWRRTVATVDSIPNGFRFHDLRHYFASTLILGGDNPKRVAKLCGHSNAEITLKVYAHLYPDSDSASRDILNAAFAEGAQRAAQPPSHVTYLTGLENDRTAAEAA